jgi:hypothetical protein
MGTPITTVAVVEVATVVAERLLVLEATVQLVSNQPRELALVARTSTAVQAAHTATHA